LVRLSRLRDWKSTQARKNKREAELARIMLRYGRLTDEAREYVAREYPQ
jgi:hypothetical protein